VLCSSFIFIKKRKEKKENQNNAMTAKTNITGKSRLTKYFLKMRIFVSSAVCFSFEKIAID